MGISSSIKIQKKQPTLYYTKLTTNAFDLTKSSPQAAGYDLCSAYDYIVLPKDRQLCKTDITLKCPPRTYGRIAPRSGLALHHFIDIGAGVIDEDFRGNVGIVLFNFSNHIFNVKKGDRIAQIIFEKIECPIPKETDKLANTQRGEQGFGSSGF